MCFGTVKERKRSKKKRRFDRECRIENKDMALQYISPLVVIFKWVRKGDECQYRIINSFSFFLLFEKKKEKKNIVTGLS